MIATLAMWPYGTFRRTADPCMVFGFKEDSQGLVRLIVADLKSGELSVVDLKDVTIDKNLFCAK